MKIYQAEAAVHGLSQKIQNNLSIAFSAPVLTSKFARQSSKMNKWLMQACDIQDGFCAAVQDFSVASKDDMDLYPATSLLVSTIWNKNDDVFLPYETWAARHTPVHKPSNFNHNEHQIIGHITDTWACDNAGSIILDNTSPDDLPVHFHIVIGSVIYLAWTDESVVSAVADLIEDIEQGRKFVSMEVLFSDFHYALANEQTNNYTLVSRNEDTAWMTKHLRAYGGTGQLRNQRIGRVLRQMTFCGHGYVDNPANERSVVLRPSQTVNQIFQSAAAINAGSQCVPLSQLKKDDTLFDDGVTINTEANASLDTFNNMEKNMPDEQNTPSVESLQTELTKAQEQLIALQAKLDARAEESQAALTAKDEELAVATKALEDLQVAKTQVDTQHQELQEAHDTLQTANADLISKVSDLENTITQFNRISLLVDGGFTKEAASEKVTTLHDLSDEQFETVAQELIKTVQVLAEHTQDTENGNDVDETEQDSQTAHAAEQALNNAQVDVDEVVVTGGDVSPDDEMQEIRDNLTRAIAAKLGCDSEEKE